MNRLHTVAASLALLFIMSIARPCAGSAETLTLTDCIKRAIAVAPAIDAAAAASEASRADLDEARAPLRPALHSALEYNQAPGYDERISNRGLSSGQLVADYLAFDGGRRLAQLHAARYAAQAAALGVDAARSQIIRDTKVAYFDLLRAREIESELRSNFDRLGRFAAIVKALVASGRAIAEDRLKIDVARDQAELALAKSRHARRRSSILLGSFIGAYGQDDIPIADAPAPALPLALDLSRNPILLALQKQVTAARSEVDAAHAERYPTFKLELTTGFVGVDPERTINRRGGASYDGLLSLPLFDGGAIRAHIDRAMAHEHQVRAAVRETELELSRRLAEAGSRYREAHDSLQLLARTLPTADDAFELGWARFLGGGHVTILEVLDAYNQSRQLRLDRLDQEFFARQAAAEAEQILSVND